MTEKKKGFSAGQDGNKKGPVKGNRQITVKRITNPAGNPEGLIKGGKKRDQLTPMMKAFCEDYVWSNSKSKSARAAGCTSTNPTGSANDMLGKPQVQKYLAELRADLRMNKKDVLERIEQELSIIAFSDTAEMVAFNEAAKAANAGGPCDPEKLNFSRFLQGQNGRLIKSVKQGKYAIEFSVHDKLSALDILARMNGGFLEDNKQKNVPTANIYLPDNGRSLTPDLPTEDPQE